MHARYLCDTPLAQDRRYLIEGMQEEYTELEGLKEALAAREEGKAMQLRSAAVMAQLARVTLSRDGYVTGCVTGA